MKTIDIFYKSYSKDFALLKYSLLSLTKNVLGYNKIILLIPEHEKHLFDTRELPERTDIYYVNEYGDGYLFQQWCKVSAHKYSSADYILFADSDCIFDHPINLKDFIKDDKPEILYTHYDKVGDARCWKEPTETFLDDAVQFEFMRRNCLIYHRSTLLAVAHFSPNLEYTLMRSQRFSEFNAIGAFAFKYEKEKYSFVNTDSWTYTPPKAIQLWSWVEKNNQSEVHKSEYKRALDAINSTLGLNIDTI